MEKALEIAPKDKNVFIIGGGEIYRIGIHIADKIELTRVFGNFDADVFFPEIDPNQWELQEEEFHSKDENHQYDFSYQTFIRK